MKWRAVQSSDGDALHAIFTEPGVRRFLFDDITLTRDQSQAHVDAQSRQDAWVICEDEQVLGFVSLRPTGPDVELMVAISERAWGRGLAYEASTEALARGFQKHPRILAAVDLPNERSHKLMTRLGFTATGEVPGPKFPLRTYEALRRSGT